MVLHKNHIKYAPVLRNKQTIMPSASTAKKEETPHNFKEGKLILSAKHLMGRSRYS